MSDVSALMLEGCSRLYKEGEGQLEIFRDVSLTLYPGEVVALIGPSGSGKSSLLHMAGLLEAPSSGEVFIEGLAASRLSDAERTALRRDKIGFVYQSHHLLPEFNALENVVLPQLIAGRARSAANENAERLLTRLGLAARLTHRPGQLSGGERQRVAIARALANNPKILLADEPTGNLDPKTSSGVFEALMDIVRAEGLAALIATHNYDLSARMDRAFILDQGRLLPDVASA